MDILTSGVKRMECKYGCGGTFIVSKRKRIPPHHTECAIKAATECVIQMHAKSGPYWERYKASMVNAANRYEMGMRLYVERITRS